MSEQKQTDWTLKYRPRSYKDCIGNRHIFDKLQQKVDEGFMPGLLLVGPPGVGKSTVAFIERSRLRNEGNYRKFNASSAGTIKTVREDVISLCREPTANGERRIIHFEELDSPRTRAAQEALRDPFEAYKNKVEFIVTGNSEGGIIDPIKSRLTTFHFGLVSIPEIVTYLERIIVAEAITVADGALVEKIAVLARGKLRDAATLLQLNVERGKLSRVMEAPDPEDDVKTIYKKFLAGTWDEYVKALEIAEKVIDNGTSERDLVATFETVARKNDKLPPMLRAQISRVAGEYDFRMSQSATQELQRHAFLGALFLLLQQAKKQQGKK